MKNKPVICIGAALIDESFTCLSSPLPGTSNPSIYHRSAGGVACNIANHLAFLGHKVELISHFGSDADGQWLVEQCKTAGIGISHSLQNKGSTGRFVAILSQNGDLFTAASVSDLEAQITPAYLSEKASVLQSASVLLIDCNLSSGSLNWLIEFSREEKIHCIIEPVSVPKAMRLHKINLKDVLLISPNREELVAISGMKKAGGSSEIVQQFLREGVHFVWLKSGRAGSKLYSQFDLLELPAPKVNVMDTTGAGDAALAGWMHAWLLNKSPIDCIRYGHAMAFIVLPVKGSINKNLNKDLLEKTVEKL